jgi:hypothetical protein
MRGWVAAIMVVAVCIGAGPAIVAAQETVNAASISGRVLDPLGGVVIGAQVTARQVDTNVSSSVVTGPDGRFRFPYLHVGSYEITIRAAGFAVTTSKLTLGMGAAFVLPITLSVKQVSSTETVTGDTVVLETARSQIAGTVSQTEIKTLPLNGRNLLDIALLVPGVSPTNVGGGTQLFAETSAVPGVGLSIGSQRNFSNNFIVDGLSANDDAAGLSGMSFGVDAVDQFQVITSGGQAELGRALGGYVSIATRSGTNLRQGDIYGFFRDDALNAKNPLSGTTLPMHQNQFGGSLGGPIRRDRTFFFANVEARRLDQSGFVTVSPDVTAVINARLAATGYPGPPVTTGVYPNPTNATTALAKIDHTVSSRDRLSIRYSLYDVNSEYARGVGGTSTPSASAALDNRDQAVAVGNVFVLSPRAVLETRGQFTNGNLKAPPTDPIGPAVSILGVASFGTLSVSPTARLDRMVEVVNNLSYQAGAHALKAGVDFIDNDLTITFPRASQGSYSFSTLANFLAGTYNNPGFTQTFGTTAVAQTNPNAGFYLQDEWHAGGHVTVNAGLRYDLQFLQTIATDTNNLSPRLGIVWSPGTSGRTVVRANAGRFFDRVPLRAVANALLSAGNTTDLSELRQTNVSLSPAQTGAPVFPNVLATVVPTSGLVNLTTMDPHIQNAYSNQASVEFERQIGARTTIAAGYEYLRGRQLIVQINQNVPSCAVQGSNNGCRPNAAFANNSQSRSEGHSSYNGLHVTLTQRPTAWGSYRVSYTLSKAMDDVGEAFFSQPIDAFDLSKDWGRSDDDQRHRLVATGVLAAPDGGTSTWRRIVHGFQLSGTWQYYSALPVNITTGTNTIQGTAARPTVNGAFIPRNSGIGGDFSSVSLRISRTFAAGPHARVEALVEAFNLFNRQNTLAQVAVFGSGAYPTNPAPNFGQVLVVGDPRGVQLGVRVRY